MLGFLLFIVFTITSLYTLHQYDYLERIFYPRYTTTVPPSKITVLDGDTIRVEGLKRRVQLEGIDAPELTQQCVSLLESEKGRTYNCGLKSKRILQKMINE